MYKQPTIRPRLYDNDNDDNNDDDDDDDNNNIAAPQATADAWDAYRMVDVICHEVGHQVFGNLVTCADWRQLAVNEGVASYVEYKCIAAVMHAAPAEALRFFAHAPTGM